MAIQVRIWQCNRHRPRRALALLCVTDNRVRLCDTRVSRTLKEDLCRWVFSEAVLCERWRLVGPPASAFGGGR